MEVIGHKNVSAHGDVAFLGVFTVARECAVGGSEFANGPGI